MNEKARQQMSLPSFIDGIGVHPSLQGVPLSKKTDTVKPILEAKTYTKILDLSDGKDLGEFSRIKTLCKNQKAEMMHLQREWIEATQSFKVLIEWCTYELKPNTKAGMIYE